MCAIDKYRMMRMNNQQQEITDAIDKIVGKPEQLVIVFSFLTFFY